MANIRIIETPLTDGSLVYAVSIGKEVLNCVTKKDAFALAEKFSTAINDHTNEETEVFFRAHPTYEDA
jgi:hypothetical protein